MSSHTILTIFVNVPITAAYRLLWQSLLQANELIQNAIITNVKQNSFQRAYSINDLNVKQLVQKIDKELKINFISIEGDVNGEITIQVTQNNKGEVYIIYTSLATVAQKNYPQKSQVQILLIKMKEEIQFRFVHNKKSKSDFC